MKEQVRKHKMSTVKELKNATKVELENLEQDLFDNALKCWTTRCRLIYYPHDPISNIFCNNYLKSKRRKRFVLCFKKNGTICK